MYLSKKPLDAGQRIFVELPAEILGLAEEGNPYWYLCRTADGAVHRVEVLHITQQNDDVHLVSGQDGSVTLWHTLYSKQGRNQLFEALRCQMEADGELPAWYLEALQHHRAQKAREHTQEPRPDRGTSTE